MEKYRRKIKNIKYPLVFIFSIFKLHKSIDDNQLSNILRFF